MFCSLLVAEYVRDYIAANPIGTFVFGRLSHQIAGPYLMAPLIFPYPLGMLEPLTYPLPRDIKGSNLLAGSHRLIGQFNTCRNSS